MGAPMSDDPRTAHLSCVVVIAEPGDDDTVWWQASHTGTGVEIGAALDELAGRMLSDPVTWRDYWSSPSAESPRCSFRVEVRMPDGWVVTHAEGCMRPVSVAAIVRSLAVETRSVLAHAALKRALAVADRLLAADDDGHGDREA